MRVWPLSIIRWRSIARSRSNSPMCIPSPQDFLLASVAMNSNSDALLVHASRFPLLRRLQAGQSEPVAQVDRCFGNPGALQRGGVARLLPSQGGGLFANSLFERAGLLHSSALEGHAAYPPGRIMRTDPGDLSPFTACRSRFATTRYSTTTAASPLRPSGWAEQSISFPNRCLSPAIMPISHRRTRGLQMRPATSEETF